MRGILTCGLWWIQPSIHTHVNTVKYPVAITPQLQQMNAGRYPFSPGHEMHTRGIPCTFDMLRTQPQYPPHMLVPAQFEVSKHLCNMGYPLG